MKEDSQIMKMINNNNETVINDGENSYVELRHEKKNPISQKMKFLKKYSFFFAEIFFIMLFNILYIMTLRNCYESDDECINKYKIYIYSFPIYLFLAMIIWWFYFCYHFHHKQYLWMSFFIANLLFYFVVFRGYSWKAHGGFNSILCVMFSFLLAVCYVFFIILKKIYDFEKIIFYCIVLATFFLFNCFLISRLGFTKSVFFVGYKNTKIEENANLCRYKHFLINWHEASRGLFKFFPVLFSECKKNYIPKWKTKNGFYEYPDTRTFDLAIRNYPVSIGTKIQQEMKFVSPNQSPNSEIWVDFTSDPILRINVNVNEELIKKQNELLPQSGLDMSYNGLYIFFIDALSRANFFRMYPETFKYLEQFYNNPTSEYEVFQFFRFHSIKPYTSPNVGLWRFGNSDWNNNSRSLPNKLINIEHELKDKGYINAHSNGFCKTKVSEYNPGEATETNIVERTWDHEFIAPACDEEIFDISNYHSPFKGPYSGTRRCLFGKDISDYMMEYMEKFHQAYGDNKTISSIELSDDHEGSREIPGYIQKNVMMHFNRMIDGNLLKGKAMVFLADHGQHMTPFFKDTTSGTIEMFSPILNIILPRRLADKHREILKLNEQRVVGMMDLRRVMFFLSGDNTKTDGINFLTEPIDEGRLPNDVGTSINDWQCLKPSSSVL